MVGRLLSLWHLAIDTTWWKCREELKGSNVYHQRERKKMRNVFGGVLRIEEVGAWM